MRRKTVAIALSICALIAAAAPAAAQAVQLVEASEEAVPVGAEVRMTTEDFKITSLIGTFECSGIAIEGELDENSPNVRIEPTFIFREGCNTANTSVFFGDVVLEGSPEHGGAVESFAVTVHLGSFSCSISGPLEVDYETGSDELAMSGALKSSCPIEPSLHASFTLETLNGTPLYLE